MRFKKNILYDFKSASDIRPKLIKHEFDMHHIECCHGLTTDGRVEASREFWISLGISLVNTFLKRYFQTFSQSELMYLNVKLQPVCPLLWPRDQPMTKWNLTKRQKLTPLSSKANNQQHFISVLSHSKTHNRRTADWLTQTIPVVSANSVQSTNVNEKSLGNKIWSAYCYMTDLSSRKPAAH